MVLLMSKRTVQKGADQNRISNDDGESWRRGPCIGKGGFASVYLATATKSISQQCGSGPLPAQIAVKSAEYSASTTLQKERKVLTHLHDFSHVIRCFGEEITDGKRGEKVYNLLLEYASGGSLYDLIFNQTCCCGLPESDVRRYTRSILEGIKHVHDCRYAHHDIKPDNILLVSAAANCRKSSSGGSPTIIYDAKLCDFGLAKKVKERNNNTKQKDQLRGTASYLSPEAVVEGIQGPASDIWALGCVVLEMLTGMRARVRDENWSKETFYYKIGYELGSPMIPRHLSEEAKEFLKSCFAMNPEERLTAGELLNLPFLSLPTATVPAHVEKEKRFKRVFHKCKKIGALFQAHHQVIRV